MTTSQEIPMKGGPLARYEQGVIDRINNFNDPHQEWRRLCSELLGTFLLVLVAAGAGMMVQMAASNTLVQTEVPDDKRGRVMSFYTMAFFGMMPLGSLAGGVLGARLGAPATVTGGGRVTLPMTSTTETALAD